MLLLKYILIQKNYHQNLNFCKYYTYVCMYFTRTKYTYIHMYVCLYVCKKPIMSFAEYLIYYVVYYNTINNIFEIIVLYFLFVFFNCYM